MAWFGLGRSSSSKYRPGYARSSSSHGSSYSRSSSYYKRRPRDGYVNGLIHKFKHLLRELYYYLRKNPVKVFFLVIMPLISGGALAAVARQFGVKLPDFLSGKGAKEMGGAYDGYYGSKGYGHGESSSGLGGLGDMMGAVGGGGSIGTVMSLAKAFL
jgi:hypothetical protein